ncbi:MAG: metallophosphoesterase [Methanomicrobiales archaeon]|nr:metallophosphoesterase [Methanomicrobiales archaeon]
MEINFIPGGPAVLVKNELAVLVIADIHFGIEADLALHGIHITSRSKERSLRICRVVEEYRPDLLVLLGDVKHMVPHPSRQEFHEIPGVIDDLRALLPLKVTPGNHDGGIERFFHENEILPKDGAVIDEVGYLHGHTYPSPLLAGRLILAGHHHPYVTLKDEVGCALRGPAYLMGPLSDSCIGFPPRKEDERESRVLFVPAFNELSGFDLGKIAHAPFSPLSRCLDKTASEVYLADGTFLGPLSVVIGDDTPRDP